jgi:hypothetical protein
VYTSTDVCDPLYYYLEPTWHSVLLISSRGEIEVTKRAIGSNYTNPVTLKYKEI